MRSTTTERANPRQPISLRQTFLLVIGCSFATALSICGSVAANDPANSPRLLSRNTEVAFCYLAGGTRTWPILDGQLPPDSQVRVVAKEKDRLLAEGNLIEVDGLKVSVTRDGLLRVESKSDRDSIAFDLTVTSPNGSDPIKSQTLRLRPAPPSRPISYVSDLVDDIIRIFWDSNANRWRPITKDGFDQYFRRLQCQGISRLIVWQSPFPFMSDPDEFVAEDWQRFEAQARAIIDSEELTAGMEATGQLKSWRWMSQVLAMRLIPGLREMFTESAAQHGIALTASFRPFEHALAKYYEVPAFDTSGSYLWGFSPAASPAINYHADDVGFAHYREILAATGKPEAGVLETIEVPGIDAVAELVDRFRRGKRDLKVVASPFPPLDSDSFVLVRSAGKGFELQRFREIHEAAHDKANVLSGFKLSSDDAGVLRISGLRVPDDCPFLTISAASEFGVSLQFPTDTNLTLRAQAGNRIDRVNIHWSLDESTPEGRGTRVGGILKDGGFRAEFQATENSITHLLKRDSGKLPLAANQLVINLGQRWSIEMIDFNQPASRAYAVAQLRTMLSHAAYDEILINTRSHTQLAASMADGVDGLSTIHGYRTAGKNYFHLGIDRAYAPRGVAAPLSDLASDGNSIEQITRWQPGEWQGTCQSDDSPFAWRYQRNRAIADGVRQLLIDLEQEFPDVRIRAVIPQSGDVERVVKEGLATMKNADGSVYGSDYYRHIRGSLNHIPAIGEGMTMIDLTGLRVEPVFLGIRFIPDQGPLELFVTRCLQDMTRNRGSSFRGPRSFFYEAQETLRGANKATLGNRREEIIRHLLSKDEDISEVLLYEAADWTYYLPMMNPHAYLDDQTAN